MDSVLQLENKFSRSNSPRFKNRSCKIVSVVFVVILLAAGAAVAYRFLGQPNGEKMKIFRN